MIKLTKFQLELALRLKRAFHNVRFRAEDADPYMMGDLDLTMEQLRALCRAGVLSIHTVTTKGKMDLNWYGFIVDAAQLVADDDGPDPSIRFPVDTDPSSVVAAILAKVSVESGIVGIGGNFTGPDSRKELERLRRVAMLIGNEMYRLGFAKGSRDGREYERQKRTSPNFQ